MAIHRIYWTSMTTLEKMQIGDVRGKVQRQGDQLKSVPVTQDPVLTVPGSLSGFRPHLLTWGNAESVQTVLSLDMDALISKFFWDTHVKTSSKPVSLCGRRSGARSGYTLQFQRHLPMDDNYLSHSGRQDDQGTVCRVGRRKAYTWILCSSNILQLSWGEAVCKGHQKKGLVKGRSKTRECCGDQGTVCIQDGVKSNAQ